MVSKGYHFVINLGIFSKFLYQYGQDVWRRENPDSPEYICFDRSFARDQYRQSILIFGKGPIVADEPGESGFSLLHRSSSPLSTMSLDRA